MVICGPRSRSQERQKGSVMKRREFITLFGGAAASWPLAARAQQPVLPVIGILGSFGASGWTANGDHRDAFQQGLKERGFVVGENVALEFRWANSDYDRLHDMAADLVRRRVSVVVAIGNNLPARAAKAGTSTIPIVFVIGADPVRLGLVARIGRPGANITGVTLLAPDLIPKRMQLFHYVAPAAKVFGFLFNPDNAGRSVIEVAQDAVRTWGGSIEVAAVRRAAEFETAVAGLANRQIDALTTSADSVFASSELAMIATRHSLPAAFHSIQ